MFAQQHQQHRGWSGTLTVLAAVWFTLVLAGPAWAQSADHPMDQPLRVAADVGFVPFAFTDPSGKVVGFSADMAKEIAERLGRPGYEVVDSNWSAIFAGLFAKRWEFNIAPTTVTEERDKQMLYTEPYFETGFGFITMASNSLPNGPEDLRGKAVGVNTGNTSDGWATKNAATYGFEVKRYDKNADAVQAVLTNRVFANVVDMPVADYVTSQQKRVKVSHRIYTGQSFGFPFRKDDVEFRNTIERIVESMKLDGTIAKLHEKWFGSMPGLDTAMNKIWVGYGPVGFTSYTYEPHKPWSR
jgi:polar amino acid transport system substrate-binding protein